MIQEPPIDILAEKVGSKYALCVVASKRARSFWSRRRTRGLRNCPKTKRRCRSPRRKFTTASSLRAKINRLHKCVRA